MRTRRTIFTALLVLSVGLLWSVQAGAYTVFTADPPEAGNCTQCHTDWPGDTHSFHSGAFSCTVCHVNGVGVDPVEASVCAGCHGGASAILELHSANEGPGDNLYCGYCHEGVDNETRNWGQLKTLFE